MVIARDGKEYALTGDELWSAYCEQGKELLTKDFGQKIDDMFADGEITDDESIYLYEHMNEMLRQYDRHDEGNEAYNDRLLDIVIHILDKRKGHGFVKAGSVKMEEGKLKICKEFYRQGYIFKDEEAYRNRKNEPCYVPELSDTVYTGNDILSMCRGQKEFADEVFDELDWQHPSSLIEDWIVNGEWVECQKCGKYVNYGCGENDIVCPFCGKTVEEK